MDRRKGNIEGLTYVEHREYSDLRGKNIVLFENPEVLTSTSISSEQCNLSISNKNVIRGMHYSRDPHNQHMLVTCLSGQLVDYCVDVRLGSPTYGGVIKTALNASSNFSIYVPAGVAHGYEIIHDNTTVLYHLSEQYNFLLEYTVNPFDPKLKINWQTRAPILSIKDKTADFLADIEKKKLLPNY